MSIAKEETRPGSLESIGSARSVDEAHRLQEEGEEAGSVPEVISSSRSSSSSSSSREPRPSACPPESSKAPAAVVDDDQDRRNPQYIPKRGVFYEHDDRIDSSEEDEDNEDEVKSLPEGSPSLSEMGGEEGNKVKASSSSSREPKTSTVPTISASSAARRLPKSESASKWGHDKFAEGDQAPKTKDELVSVYGYDIRNEDTAPRARRRRKYGRGPNKYTRKWENEDAYVKSGGRGGKNPSRGGGPLGKKTGKRIPDGGGEPFKSPQSNHDENTSSSSSSTPHNTMNNTTTSNLHNIKESRKEEPPKPLLPKESKNSPSLSSNNSTSHHPHHNYNNNDSHGHNHNSNNNNHHHHSSNTLNNSSSHRGHRNAPSDSSNPRLEGVEKALSRTHIHHSHHSNHVHNNNTNNKPPRRSMENKAPMPIGALQSSNAEPLKPKRYSSQRHRNVIPPPKEDYYKQRSYTANKSYSNPPTTFPAGGFNPPPPPTGAYINPPNGAAAAAANYGHPPSVQYTVPVTVPVTVPLTMSLVQPEGCFTAGVPLGGSNPPGILPPPPLAVPPPSGPPNGGGYAEVRGGVTYFNPTAQAPLILRPVVNKRPKAAIPIIDPSNLSSSSSSNNEEEDSSNLSGAPAKQEDKSDKTEQEGEVVELTNNTSNSNSNEIST
eukprot:TRINITY_DN3392_c0_g1_i1.p1 TRINITY_DN3392_c0_g1~~TRINITY_DN3392_c0_g1_i1.p1  ORF type:complete len:660 (+),score=241.54 TRINITY_DN3392_c0_g1_i1:49-2028(+)